jgi:hypothetical protein
MGGSNLSENHVFSDMELLRQSACPPGIGYPIGLKGGKLSMLEDRNATLF